MEKGFVSVYNPTGIRCFQWIPLGPQGGRFIETTKWTLFTTPKKTLRKNYSSLTCKIDFRTCIRRSRFPSRCSTLVAKLWNPFAVPFGGRRDELKALPHPSVLLTSDVVVGLLLGRRGWTRLSVN